MFLGFPLSLIRHSVKLTSLYISSRYWFNCVMGLVSWCLIFYLDRKLAVTISWDLCNSGNIFICFLEESKEVFKAI